MFRKWAPTIIKYCLKNRTIISPQFNFRLLRKFISSKLLKTPLAIMVEPTCMCNIQCPLCTTPHKYMTRTQGIMEFDTYQKLLDDVKEFALIFYFNFAGEPFLNPHLFQMVKEAAKNDIFTMVDTNATLLTYARIQEILDSKLSILVVNIDYAKKESFEQFRKGANFHATMKGIKELCDLKKKKNGTFPLVVAETIVSRANEIHLNELYDFAMNTIGVDGVWFKPLCFPLHSKGFRENNEVEVLVDKYLPRTSSIKRYTYNEGHLQLDHYKNFCEWEYKSVILWDGRVAACCFDYDGNYTFGNIREASFLDIWNSPKYRYYREKLIKPKKLELCEFCSII
ncbi:MAG: hypothetical protein BAJALOKI1v1_1100003 [Promethearchaeota archaeon]|nr:MAG: hypothetical protein BAJALOKI1v1_1100003 [Candidatus Lokiarchaeota archaeon]